MNETKRTKQLGSRNYVTHLRTGTHQHGWALTRCGAGSASGNSGAHFVVASTQIEEVTCARCLAAQNTPAKKGETRLVLSVAQLSHLNAAAQALHDNPSASTTDWSNSEQLVADTSRALRRAEALNAAGIALTYKGQMLKLAQRLLAQ